MAFQGGAEARLWGTIRFFLNGESAALLSPSERVAAARNAAKRAESDAHVAQVAAMDAERAALQARRFIEVVAARRRNATKTGGNGTAGGPAAGPAGGPAGAPAGAPAAPPKTSAEQAWEAAKTASDAATAAAQAAEYAMAAVETEQGATQGTMDYSKVAAEVFKGAITTNWTAANTMKVAAKLTPLFIYAQLLASEGRASAPAPASAPA